MELSVIIPTLNEGKYLRNTLECLRKQTFQNFETIIVDGGSTDATRDIAHEYTERVFISKEGGVPLARNYGAKKAKGNILAMTDADCILPPNWLEIMHKDFRKHNVEMVWGPLEYDQEATLSARIFAKVVWGLYRFIWKYVVWVSNPNLAFTKEGFKKIGGYRKDVTFMDEYDIGVRARRTLKFYFDPDNVVIFSGRRFKRLHSQLPELVKYMRSLISYNMTNSIYERFVPSTAILKNTKDNRFIIKKD